MEALLLSNLFLVLILLGVSSLCFVFLLVLNSRLSGMEEALRKRLEKLEDAIARRPSGSQDAPKAEQKSTGIAPRPAKTGAEKTPVEKAAAIPKPSPSPEFESGAATALRKAWVWLLMGEEREGVSLEYAVATTWLTRGAIVIILAALAFGVKLSIERGMLGPELRLALSFIAGLAMLSWGLLLTKGHYRTAGKGLIGGGLAALYFSAFASSMIYHFVGPLPAFVMMALITALSCGLALRVDSLFLASIGTLGGYVTPIALDTGEKNLVGLFGYLCVLGLGLLFVAKRRDWKFLNAISLLFTWGLFIAALAKSYDKAVDFPASFAFACAFFLIFSCVPLLNNLAGRAATSLLELFLLGINSLSCFAAAQWLIETKFAPECCAAAALGLALYHIVFAFAIRRGGSGDSALFNMLYMFAAFFAAYSIPLLLGSKWVAPAWALQALAMLWLAKRLDGKFLKALSFVLFALAFWRTSFLELQDAFSNMSETKYLGELLPRIGSFGALIASLGCAWSLLRPRMDEKSALLAAALFASGFLLSLFLYLSSEVNACASIWRPGAAPGALSAFWGAYALAMLAAGIWRKAWGLRLSGLILFLITAFKIFLFDLGDLSQGARVAAFLALGLITLAGAFVYMRFRSFFERDDTKAS